MACGFGKTQVPTAVPATASDTDQEYHGYRWNKNQQSCKSEEQKQVGQDAHGFGSLSRRQLSKPLIAAVNGGAHGGGTEIVLNCDIVVAGEDAKFALPEVKRGVVAAAGGECTLGLSLRHSNIHLSLGIPRLAHIAGHHVWIYCCRNYPSLN